MASNCAFVALQDRFVSSLAVACCPTMDLIAVLTLDHHLLVHRTTSWQKLLHIKPSDVGFEMVKMVWKPDGLQLAVGGNEGNVAIYEIESGESLPKRRSSFCHTSSITAMDWICVQVSGFDAQNSQRCRKSIASNSQSKVQFQDRSTRFLEDLESESRADKTVLVSADEKGFIALWWYGRVLMTRFDVSKHFTEEEYRVMETMGYQREESNGFCIEKVNLAPDFSVLLIIIVFRSQTNELEDNAIEGQSGKKIQRVLTLNMKAIQSIYEDMDFVASTVDRNHSIVTKIFAGGRQMVTEWKNAMRLFELKVGLMGPLYEKYACEDSPQADMLSLAVTGITAPALAQYFAQDIQEMSVHRMQKALFDGCEIVRVLADENMKSDLVKFLFLVSELRGHLKWDSQTYVNAIGIKVDALDDLVQITQNLLVEMETLTLALHETRQDFSLFFQWILERIRFHTSSSQSEGNTSSHARDAGGSSGTKSLLNLRRLCDFLDHAAQVAKEFRKHQQNGGVYTVETTFGNSVSQHLSMESNTQTNEVMNTSTGCLFLIHSLQETWFTMLDAIGGRLARSVVRENSGCFGCITSFEECHIRFRQPFRSKNLDYLDDVEDKRKEEDNEDEESDDEAVDWHALKHFGPMQNTSDCDFTILIGFRLRSGDLLLVKQVDSVHAQPFRLEWEMAVICFSKNSLRSLSCQGFDFYGDVSNKRPERLAFVVDHVNADQVLERWLYLHQYDHIHFSRFDPAAFLESAKIHDQSHTFQLDQLRRRKVASLPAVHSNKGSTSVIATASRGILCIILSPSRLIVYDAEDDEDEEEKAGCD
ncbi:putative WD40/YVTN repeat-like-containing domain superfamily, anaphase-promoting complex subunit 4 [Plasmopara halstedii]